MYKKNSRFAAGEDPPSLMLRRIRAEDRARTGHLDLGKVALYQMSYFR
jgi:hypothetical protein